MHKIQLSLIVTLILLAANAPLAVAQKWIASPPRTVVFPSNRSLGVLFVRRWAAVDPADMTWEDRFTFGHWKKLGEALGRVAVPAEMELALLVSDEARDERSPLADLRPNDLQSLHLNTQLADTDLANIKHLTGLRQLIIGNSPDLGDAGLAHLKGLASLEFLVVWGCRRIDTGLGHLKNLPLLSELALGGTTLTDPAMTDIARLPALKKLQLLWDDVSDAGIGALGQSRSLDHLGLIGLDVTEAGIAGLKGSPLKGLSLEGCKAIDDKALSHLSDMKSLVQLEVPGTPVTDSGLEALLKALPRDKIEVLWLGATQATNRTLESLAGMTQLRELDLAGLALTDDGMRSLKSLPKLRLLRLMGTGLTDKSVPYLSRLKALERLNVVDTEVTQAGAKALRAALPGCVVLFGKRDE